MLALQGRRATFGGSAEEIMEADEVRKKPAAHEVGMNIDAMSIDELRERIALLEEEIARLRRTIEARDKTRSAAESVFKF